MSEMEARYAGLLGRKKGIVPLQTSLCALDRISSKHSSVLRRNPPVFSNLVNQLLDSLRERYSQLLYSERTRPLKMFLEEKEQEEEVEDEYPRRSPPRPVISDAILSRHSHEVQEEVDILSDDDGYFDDRDDDQVVTEKQISQMRKPRQSPDNISYRSPRPPSRQRPPPEALDLDANIRVRLVEEEDEMESKPRIMSRRPASARKVVKKVVKSRQRKRRPKTAVPKANKLMRDAERIASRGRSRRRKALLNRMRGYRQALAELCNSESVSAPSGEIHFFSGEPVETHLVDGVL